MPSYVSILSAALLVSASATRAAPLAANHAGPDNGIVMILLGLPVHKPCATLRELREHNLGCETETFLFFDALFSDWCTEDSETRHDEDAKTKILGLFRRAARGQDPRQS